MYINGNRIQIPETKKEESELELKVKNIEETTIELKESLQRIEWSLAELSKRPDYFLRCERVPSTECPSQDDQYQITL